MTERIEIMPSWKDDGQTLPYRLGKACRPSEYKSDGARILTGSGGFSLAILQRRPNSGHDCIDVANSP